METNDALPAEFAKEKYCYLTTTGRISGKKHTIEVWLVLRERTLYILNGPERSNWVKNAMREPRVTIRIRNRVFNARARIVEDEAEAALARAMTSAKYGVEAPEDWAQTALVVAFDLDAA